MVKYEKKTFSIDEAEEEEMPLQKIAKLIAQEYDNEIAKAFTLHITKLLKDNGIVPIMTKYTTVEKFGISFDGLDTSEHDAKVRAETIDEFVDALIKPSNYERFDFDEMLTDSNKTNDFFKYVFAIAEQLKEQKE